MAYSDNFANVNNNGNANTNNASNALGVRPICVRACAMDYVSASLYRKGDFNLFSESETN